MDCSHPVGGICDALNAEIPEQEKRRNQALVDFVSWLPTEDWSPLIAAIKYWNVELLDPLIKAAQQQQKLRLLARLQRERASVSEAP